MDNKTFLNISAAECLIVYKDIIKNSDKRWESGLLLAKNGDYALGISTSIISIEELIKAIIIFLDGKGFDLRKSKGIDSFFRNHEIRYLLAYFIFIITLAGDELKKWIEKINNNQEQANFFLKNIRVEKKDWFEKYRYYFLRKLIILKSELNWFSQIDLFRQRGFYCDYSTELKNPVHISEREFKEVIFRLEKIRNAGIFFLEELSKNEFESQEQIKQLKKDFQENNFYELISKGLESIKKSKRRPFEYLKESVNNL
jgi:AbiV family abortive infection protein